MTSTNFDESLDPPHPLVDSAPQGTQDTQSEKIGDEFIPVEEAMRAVCRHLLQPLDVVGHAVDRKETMTGQGSLRWLISPSRRGYEVSGAWRPWIV
jgi:hypothetical protein